jgi:hypothetical protein
VVALEKREDYPRTAIRYGLTQKSAVQLSAYNTPGQQVATPGKGEKEAGIRW